MKARIPSSLLALALFAAPALAGSGHAPSRVRALAPAEAAGLRAVEAAPLGELRAGTVRSMPSIADDERAVLPPADQAGSGLRALRAGDITLTHPDPTIT